MLNSVLINKNVASLGYITTTDYYLKISKNREPACAGREYAQCVWSLYKINIYFPLDFCKKLIKAWCIPVLANPEIIPPRIISGDNEFVIIILIHRPNIIIAKGIHLLGKLGV